MQLSEVKWRDDIGKLLISMNAEYVCEVGVLRGAGLKRLAVPCVKRIDGVDEWKPYGEKSNYDLETCMQQANKVAKQIGRVVLNRTSSAKAAAAIKDNTYDLVFIDASHFYNDVCEDLELWWPKVKPGGVLSGHDYVEKSRFGDDFGVMEAVDEFVEEHGLTLYTTKDKWTSWLVAKEQV